MLQPTIGFMATDNEKKKYKAIKSLIENSPRASEWQEAGLLNAIEKIVTDEVTDLSSASLKKLTEEARYYRGPR